MTGTRTFWLPPMVTPAPDFTGEFDESADPLVQVCLGQVEGCTDPVKEFTLSTGLTVNGLEEWFGADWYVFDHDPTENDVFRISVWMSGQLLGYADLMVVDKVTGQVKKSVGDEFLLLSENNGRWFLPIRFRVEDHAIITRVTVEPSSLVLTGIGSSTRMVARAFNEMGTEIRGVEFAWRSLNTLIVDVVGTNGELSAMGVGQASVEAAVNGVRDFGVVTVASDLPAQARSWTIMEAYPNLRTLYSVWGTSDRDVFVGGVDLENHGVILHYDGASWSGMDFYGGEVTQIWGFGSENVFAVDGGRTYRYTGTTWEVSYPGGQIPGFYLKSVWGSSPDNVFAGGNDGRVLRFDGEEWRLNSSSINTGIWRMWGSGPEDIFAACMTGQNMDIGDILHFNGTDWTPMEYEFPWWIYSVRGLSPTQVFAVSIPPGPVAYEYDGSQWRDMEFPYWEVGGADFFDVWPISDQEVLFAGNSWADGPVGLISSWNGNSFEHIELPEGTPTLFGIWVAPNGEVFAVGWDDDEGAMILHGQPL